MDRAAYRSYPQPCHTGTFGTINSGMSILRCFALLLSGLALAQSQPSMAASTCFGSVSNGRLEAGVQLPISGNNFSTYSVLAASTGRTFVHSSVAEIIVAAYASIYAASPESLFVYGETGWPTGGRLRPHRTHQNGTSVDFFVPVRDQSGKSVPLPTGSSNRYGYDIEFDASGKYDGYKIDFESLGEHLYQLHVAAKARDAGFALVIFDTAYLPALFATKRGAYLKKHLPFLQRKPWVRHDEHFHIDFDIACKPEPN